jgi:hypothetical protein
VVENSKIGIMSYWHCRKFFAGVVDILQDIKMKMACSSYGRIKLRHHHGDSDTFSFSWFQGFDLRKRCFARRSSPMNRGSDKRKIWIEKEE